MLSKIQSIDGIDVSGKTVILRIDINSSVRDGTIIKGPKILEHSKTIRLLSEKGAKIVVLSHQGREGKPDFISLEPHYAALKEIVGEIEKTNVFFAKWSEDYLGKIKSLKNGEVLLLDNTRFLDFESKELTPEEHAKNPVIKNLASAANIFVLDALSVAHRSHATVVGFIPLLPSYAGYYLMEVLNALKQTEEVKNNICLVLGGLKPEDSLEVMTRMLKENRAKSVLLGGILGELALKAKGNALGAKEVFLEQKDLNKFVPQLKKLLDIYGARIFIPSDLAVEKRGKRREIPIEKLPTDYMIYDVGHHTINHYCEQIENAALVIYNGPFGVFENYQFATGTKEVLDCLKEHSAFSLIGGGDTVTALLTLGFRKKNFSHVSLAGKALLQYLAGEELPGITALAHKALVQKAV